jgi:transposase
LARSEEFSRWEEDLVAAITRRYPASDRDDLRSELMLALLTLKRKRPLASRGYLAKSLLNKASQLVRRWRRGRAREVADADVIDIAAAPPTVDDDPSADLILARQALSRQAYAFLLRVAKAGGNVSRLARETGRHRNTIATRLHRLQRAICCIKKWSSGTEWEVGDLSETWCPRTERDRLRQQIILSLAAGESYRALRKRLGVSQQTILACRRKFEQHGPEGLSNRSRGRQLSTRRRRLESWLRQRGENDVDPLPAALAKRFQLHRVTVLRILKSLRR